MIVSKLDHFGWLSPYYDKLFKTDYPERIIQLTDLPIQGSVLDVGGGTGRISKWMIGLAGQVVIADSSFKMLLQAKKKDKLQAVCAHSEILPFKSMSFERVIIVDAFHHVINQRETVQELWRVLKPGGRIVIEEPDVHRLIVKILAVVEKLLLMRTCFFNPFRIANMAHFPGASITIKQEGYTSWVIIEKNLNQIDSIDSRKKVVGYI
jgi:demethylmenaquinone methyltransferase/2-methoxy-6-polyprenyl-1,4-benzoquinol methylase